MAVLSPTARRCAIGTFPQFSVTGGDVAPHRLEILNGMEAIVVGDLG